MFLYFSAANTDSKVAAHCAVNEFTPSKSSTINLGQLTFAASLRAGLHNTPACGRIGSIFSNMDLENLPLNRLNQFAAAYKNGGGKGRNEHAGVTKHIPEDTTPKKRKMVAALTRSTADSSVASSTPGESCKPAYT